jgi:hypothetical protein
MGKICSFLLLISGVIIPLLQQRRVRGSNLGTTIKIKYLRKTTSGATGIDLDSIATNSF